MREKQERAFVHRSKIFTTTHAPAIAPRGVNCWKLDLNFLEAFQSGPTPKVYPTDRDLSDKSDHYELLTPKKDIVN